MGLLFNEYTPMAWIDYLILAFAIAFATWTTARLGFRRARQDLLPLAFAGVALMTVGSGLGLEHGSVGRWALRVAAVVLVLVGCQTARNVRRVSPDAVRDYPLRGNDV